MTTVRPLVAMLLAAFCAGAVAQEGMLTPPAALVMDNVPPVPSAVAARVSKYTEFKPTGIATWHPTKKEMLVVRRYRNTPQIFRVARPGAPLELMTDYPEPVTDASYEPKKGGYYVFNKDVGGNEVFRAYRRSGPAGEAVPITPDGQRVSGLEWAHSGKRIVFSTVPVNRQGANDSIDTTVYLGDPLHPDHPRKLAELPGGGWGGYAFSHDDKRLLLEKYVSANESEVFVMDLASGRMEQLTHKEGELPVAYSEAQFSRDGKGIYMVSDKDSEFQRLVYLDLATRQQTVLSSGIDWDIGSVQLSDDGKLIAFVANEDGSSVLRLMRAADRKLLPLPKLPVGTVGGVQWHKNSTDLGLSITSATSPSEVYSLDVKTNALTRWTNHEKTEVDASKFPAPVLVHWKSFDGRTISGFLYRAPADKFPGKRPVIVNIHGGPEGQSRPGFIGRNNYYMNELGISMLFPNVRGSTGYGKTFLKLDNGMQRLDSVKDIGALFDWIATQPDLDPARVAVAGGSYGGYMTLAVSTMYSDRIAAANDVVGISNFVTFLEKTESYRRDLRRVEYGDEREPAMRKFMEESAPVNNAEKIRKPLFVVQGKNDPRVPYQEADQIVATVRKNGTPVWYMMANDEGHGFNKKANADYQFYSTIGFFEKYLLGK
jgi:dipeptidyl aminopeptidase/acylaminoacyl peptidase